MIPLLFVPFIFAALAGSIAYLRPKELRWQYLTLIFLAWPPLFVTLLGGLRLITVASTVRYDEYLAVVDSALGQPSFVLGRIVWQHPWLHSFALQYYAWSLLFPMIVLVPLFLSGRVQMGFRGFLAFLASPMLAGFIYKAFPASGPVYAFSSYPFAVPNLDTLHVLTLHSAPNCMPSVHTSVALLALAFLWRWPLGKVFGFIHVFLTVFVTLGLGEHYLIDLIAALPYTAFVYWLSGLPFLAHARSLILSPESGL